MGNALGTHSGSISVIELGGTKPLNHEKNTTNLENHDESLKILKIRRANVPGRVRSQP